MPVVDIDVQSEAARLEEAHPREVIEWAIPAIGENYAIACSFQSEDLVLLHLARQAFGDGVRALFLQTGFHFKETLELRDKIVDEWKINLVQTKGPGGLGLQTQTYGAELFRRDPTLCCHVNKVKPLAAGLDELDGWVTGVRRDQAPTRAGTPVVQSQAVQSGRQILKVNPLVRWTRADVAEYTAEHNIPSHPLYAQNYLSIGCEPCTRPVMPGEDERAGRWAGSGKVECGIHTAEKA